MADNWNQSNNKGAIHLLTDWDSKFSSNQEQIQKVNLITSILGFFWFVFNMHIWKDVVFFFKNMTRFCWLLKISFMNISVRKKAFHQVFTNFTELIHNWLKITYVYKAVLHGEKSNLVGPKLGIIHPRYQSKRSPSLLEAVRVKHIAKGVSYQAIYF